MDDYSVESLSESKNEWCARLINILTPAITNEFNLIFKDALKVCIDNDEEDKYLMTFQVYLSGIPKWNKSMIDTSAKRAVDFTRCSYLEDLITCIHVIQLKALSCVRVCQKQKKVDINIPSIDVFLHRVYLNVARKIYMNIYLYEKDISPLQIQKNNREIEVIIKECILNTIRETMPIETILRSYMDENEEQTVVVKEEVVIQAPPTTTTSAVKIGQIEEKKLLPEEKPMITKKEDDIKIEPALSTGGGSGLNTVKTSNTSQLSSQQIDKVMKLNETITSPQTDIIKNIADIAKNISTGIANNTATATIQMNDNNISQNVNSQPKTNNKNVMFSDTDYTMDVNGKESIHDAPKTIERLEKISLEKKVKDSDYDDNNDDYDDDEYESNKLKIGSDVNIDFDIVDEMNKPIKKDNLLEGIEILEL